MVLALRQLHHTLLIAAVLAAGPAAAQPAAQPTVETQVAQKHYELGDKLYTNGNYRQALVEFNKAYKLSPRPELLFNLARCHEVLGDLERAVASYQGYLDKKPDARNRDTVKARIKNLQQRIAARPPEPAPAQSQPATTATEPPPSRWKRTAGWITAGVGAAALVTGVVFGALAQGKSDAFDDNLTILTYNELDAIDADGERFETIQIVTLAVGGAALAAGGGLLLWDLLTRKGTSGERRDALLTPFTTGRGAGLVGRVRF